VVSQFTILLVELVATPSSATSSSSAAAAVVVLADEELYIVLFSLLSSLLLLLWFFFSSDNDDDTEDDGVIPVLDVMVTTLVGDETVLVSIGRSDDDNLVGVLISGDVVDVVIVGCVSDNIGRKGR
jgi:hypothetical protein